MTLEVVRTGQHRFTGRNGRGAEVPIGRREQDGTFSPAELLQIAAAGCAIVTGESLIARRLGQDTAMRAEVSAEQRPGAHELDAVDVRFDLDLSTVDEAARAELAEVVERAIERLCTVSRTLRSGVPVRDTVVP
ncbi:osmotically inducible protein C [Amycolatopsis antarctica]|uniref:Osmotically inducible protein C n=1 Tax=Amycolatopsis antarctica TaxID=1854586 RepID=A0A263D6Q8_9PSEU|nr:OsmC family protein [Amycolatopsis antarctica]OZM73869.1 osmotically inducible protein C [Amycolatopsis antarctica]